MSILKKSLLLSVLAIVFVISTTRIVLAENSNSLVIKNDYSEEYKQYLKLTEDEKANTTRPIMFNILKTNTIAENPFRLIKKVGASQLPYYSLKDDIPNNVVIKNQGTTNTCWAFASLSSLETHLALKSSNKSKVYDFSERHMNYSTTREFLNSQINPIGFNRKINGYGDMNLSMTYLTNGIGAIEEKDMPFVDTNDLIDINDIQNKTVASQVYDMTVISEDECTEEVKNQIKDYIKNYGAVSANIHGATIFSDYYNNTTGAIYCDDSVNAPVNHAVSIIGWDDNYAIENFNSEHRPLQKGAWIIKNSWGDQFYTGYTLARFKEGMFDQYKEECLSRGWTESSQIPDEIIIRNGYIINDNKVYRPIANGGFMYLSYEDVNAYSLITGIEKADETVNYENIYQYNEYGAVLGISANQSKIYLANIFDKKTSGKEYINQVSIYAPETYTCKVYVNPNGESTAKNDLVPVTLKKGETETFDSGYHTIEFLKPIKIKSDKFVVVIEIVGTRNNTVNIAVESKVEDSYYEFVEIEEGKCLLTYDDLLNKNEWVKLSKLKDISELLENGDSTIKAFTISEGEDEEIDDESEKKGEKEDEREDKGPIEDEDKSEDEDKNNEEEIPEISNTNMDNANVETKSIKSYSFTTNKKEYVVLDLQVNNIEREMKNNFQYYYYLSANQNEENIDDWIEITDEQKSKSNLKITINSDNIDNYNELVNSNKMYLYIKEIASNGQKEKTAISKGMPVATTVDVEQYVDNVKVGAIKPENNGNAQYITTGTSTKSDGTLATGKIPSAGIQKMFIIIISVFTFGIIVYLRYRSLKDIK